jgi:hypothetical protein
MLNRSKDVEIFLDARGGQSGCLGDRSIDPTEKDKVACRDLAGGNKVAV